MGEAAQRRGSSRDEWLLMPVAKRKREPLTTGSDTCALSEKPMLHPAAKLLRRAAELHRIRRVRPLHHHALEEIAAEHTVGLAEPLVERERGVVAFDAQGRRKANGVDRD